MALNISVLDPDQYWIRVQILDWIWIRIKRIRIRNTVKHMCVLCEANKIPTKTFLMYDGCYSRRAGGPDRQDGSEEVPRVSQRQQRREQSAAGGRGNFHQVSKLTRVAPCEESGYGSRHVMIYYVSLCFFGTVSRTFK